MPKVQLRDVIGFATGKGKQVRRRHMAEAEYEAESGRELLAKKRAAAKKGGGRAAELSKGGLAARREALRRTGMQRKSRR